MIAEERDGTAVQSLTGDIVESEAVEDDRRNQARYEDTEET